MRALVDWIEAAAGATRPAGERPADDRRKLTRKAVLMESHAGVVGTTAIALGARYDLTGPCPLPGLDAEMATVPDLAGLVREPAPLLRKVTDQSRLRG